MIDLAVGLSALLRLDHEVNDGRAGGVHRREAAVAQGRKRLHQCLSLPPGPALATVQPWQSGVAGGALLASHRAMSSPVITPRRGVPLASMAAVRVSMRRPSSRSTARRRWSSARIATATGRGG